MPAPIGHAPPAPSRLLDLQRLAGNRAVAGLLRPTVQRDGDEDNPYDTPPAEKVTGYLGLNPQAGKGATGLRNASRQQVLVSLNNPDAEKKLQENPAIFDFMADELGIDPDATTTPGGTRRATSCSMPTPTSESSSPT